MASFHQIGCVLVVVTAAMTGAAWGQNPIFSGPNNDPINQQGSGNLFYFDSNSDCNTGIRNINNFKATIEGHGGASQSLGPSSCTIKLKSEGQFEGTILNIEVRSMDIRDCTTRVAIYDGDGAQLLLQSYDCRDKVGLNRRTMQTTGNTATFIMNRDNIEQWNFDVEIIVDPIRGGLEPGFENNYGTDFYFDKFEQAIIVGLIGGFYLLILLICVIVMVCSFRSFYGKNKEWETHQLAVMKTGAGFDGRSQMSQPTNAWSTDLTQSRGPASQYSRGHTKPYARSHAPASEDGDSDDTFQRRRLMNEERDRYRNGPPTYASRNDSFVEPESPDHFKEKVITPRVRPTNKRQGRPPSYEEAISDHPSDHSSDEEESNAESSDDSVRKKPVSSEEESERSSRSETESEEESEEEESSDDDSRRGRGARAGRRKPRNDKRHHKLKPKKTSSRDSRDGDGPSRRHPGPSAQPPPPMHPMQAGPYPGYPPGQFVPVMAGPPQFQTVPMVPAYPAPRYPEDEPRAAPRGPDIQPTDPPVYSYLVRRGYTPMDQHNSSAASMSGSQRSGADRVDEPDIRLESGVEYMRR
ncbi:nucleolar and coiled-body phosphoprotein 1 isoform X2 [Aplysia californica]|uniref:Nucleolar and coiled-body phosphoprotein 1 isoform X2 n=1 Tax=Aplysia californica TaxID=6500 RepID=A0ABM0K9U0_APLCA|nr:nucleolar and coiled-body phosphoprotein 1 isoform X2 [Aplysia californica]